MSRWAATHKQKVLELLASNLVQIDTPSETVFDRYGADHFHGITFTQFDRNYKKAREKFIISQAENAGASANLKRPAVDSAGKNS